MTPPTDDPERARESSQAVALRARAEQVGYLHDHGVAGATVMLVVAALYAAVMWPAVDQARLLPWLGVVALVCAARAGLALYWQRRAAAHGEEFWARTALIGGALAGCAWGYAAVALFPLDHPPGDFVAALLLVGLPAAALASLGAWTPAYGVYAVAAIAPFVIRMFGQGQPHFVLAGIAGTIFFAYLLRKSQRSSALIRRSIEQRIELQQMSQRLAQARDAAESGNRAKSAFLANMSHELRTPLNAVVGLSDLMVEQAEGARGRELAAAMRQTVLSLLGVIDNVVDMSSIEAGRIEVRQRVFEPRALMRDVLAMFRPEARRRGLALDMFVDGAVPPQLTGDPDRIRQVLVNLIDNALKFTAAGSVTVRVTIGPRGDGRYLLRFEVADTGPGVEPSARGRLFDASLREEVFHTRVRERPGLGLSICAALVRAMEGEIDYRSEPGRGAAFWFTCAVGIAPPTSKVQAPATQPTAPARLSVPRVLVVDDNEVNLFLTTQMLESIGCGVQTASDGIEGLNRMHGEAFDLVLMDLSMPGMDGIETTRRWRAHERDAEQRLPIVALTANAVAGDRQACLAAGMDDYLAKPVTLDALRHMVARHVPGAAA